jgi:thiosulfate dehydrogenase [quinone] large subunit
LAQVSKKKAKPAPSPPPRPNLVTDRWVGYAILPLRLFLGVTFLYAGLQKISDPGFLTPGAPTYIGTQLTAFAIHSPIALLINTFALPAPQLTGMAVIVTELAIGAATVLGLWTRWAAAAGALVNFVLFLTASWTIQPYFLGSDSIYAVAWITIALTGDLGVMTVQRQLLAGLGFGPGAVRPARFDPARRRMLLQAGGAAVALVWALSVIPRLKNAPAASATPTPSPDQSPSPAATPTAGATPSPSPSPTPTGTKIGSVADLQSQGSLPFQDPRTGDPGLAVQVSGGKVVAFDAVCTHAGCTVSYDTGQKLFVCPCHGAEFDPANNAAVVAGPAPTPLSGIGVTVSAGDVYTT